MEGDGGQGILAGEGEGEDGGGGVALAEEQAGDGGSGHADEDRAADAPVEQDGDEDEAADGEEDADVVEVADLDGDGGTREELAVGREQRGGRHARGAAGDDAGFVEADKGEEQANADAEGVLHAEGDGVEEAFAEVDDGEQEEGRPADENGAEALFPGDGDGEGGQAKSDEGVFAHVGGDGDGAVGVEAHEEAAEDGGEDGGDGAGADGDTGVGEDGGVDDDDVGHGDESGQAAEHLDAERRAALADGEEAVEGGVGLGESHGEPPGIRSLRDCTMGDSHGEHGGHGGESGAGLCGMRGCGMWQAARGATFCSVVLHGRGGGVGDGDILRHLRHGR